MKILLKRSCETLGLWHFWFAWRPVVAYHYWVWLETVHRKGTMHFQGGRIWWTWEYKVRGD